MKKLLFILFITCGVHYSGQSQISLVPASIAKHLPDSTTIVKDSTGRQYTYNEWTLLMATRKYTLKGHGKRDADNKYKEYRLRPLFAEDGSRIVTAAIKYNMPAPSEQFKPGDKFYPFNEKDITGVKFDLKKMPGKVFVINFWFIGCPPCRAEIPDLNRVAAHYKNNADVVFIAICLDGGYAIDEFTKTSPYNYHIIADGQYLANKYGVHLFPTNLVVNKEGKVVYSSVGGQPGNPYWIIKKVDESLQPTETVSTVPKS